MNNIKRATLAVLLLIISMNALAQTNKTADQQLIDLQQQIKLLSAEIEKLKNSQPVNISDIRYEADRTLQEIRRTADSTSKTIDVWGIIFSTMMGFLALVIAAIGGFIFWFFKASISKYEKDSKASIAKHTTDLQGVVTKSQKKIENLEKEYRLKIDSLASKEIGEHQATLRSIFYVYSMVLTKMYLYACNPFGDDSSLNAPKDLQAYIASLNGLIMWIRHDPHSSNSNYANTLANPLINDIKTIISHCESIQKRRGNSNNNTTNKGDN